MSDEDLHDIVNAKAEYKKSQQKKAETKKEQAPQENALESLLKGIGALQ